MWPFRRKHRHELSPVAEDPGVIAAGEQAARARHDHAEQERKHEQEREAVTNRLRRLAAEDSNHVGTRVLEALTERYHLS